MVRKFNSWLLIFWGGAGLGGLRKKKDVRGGHFDSWTFFASNAVFRTHGALGTRLSCQEVGRFECWRLAKECNLSLHANRAAKRMLVAPSPGEKFLSFPEPYEATHP